ncbi:MAG: hypothetical protein FJX72_19035, partial [Armatimonadetes bacterium]|nr:hypothetical protein [Armatimonadota bacterium]
PVQGACEAVVTPWGRSPIKHPLGQVVLPAGGARLLRFKQPASVYGPYDVLVTFGQREAVRKWRGSFAYMRTSDVPGRSSGPLSRFGACGNVGGFDALLKPATERLNRMGGFGWTRIGLAWAQVNPAPGVWAWDPPTPTAGPVGTAARIGGRTYRAPHNSVLNCPDEVTIACWARLDGPTGARQIALRKWGPGVARNYGAFFDRETGAFTFSAGYERGPGAAPASRRQAVVEFNAGPNTWDRQWRHYAATYSRHIRSVCLYVDGVLRTSAIHDGGRLRTNDADLLIGQDLAGDLDEVLVYRRALGPADIAALARKSSPPKDGLLAWYSFDVPGGIGRNRAVVAVTAAGRVAAGSPRAPFGGSANVTPPLAAANVAPKSRRQLDLVPVEPDGARLALEAHAQGMRTLAILGFPPAWASSRPDAPRFWVHEPDLKAWSAYVEAVTRQYRDRISCWEIWNEPNSAEFWEPAPDPARYLTVLKVAYAAAKRGNPRCKVVMPGLGGLPADGRANRNRLLPLAPDRDYMDRLLSLGAARYCDAISVHPYPSGTPEETDLAGDLRWIAAKCAATGVKRPIWITEIGWPTQVPVAGGTPALLGQGGVSERMQSALLARTAIVAVGSGLVERMFWFRLHDSGPDRMSADDSFGLCREDLSPKPAFFAHRTVAVLLGDARPTGEIALGRHVIAKVFQSPNER